jgi:hypothetical protein
MKFIKLFILSLLNVVAFAQSHKVWPVNVLFLGNGYTYANNLPQISVGVAASSGDVIAFDNYTPGGYSFQQHASDTNAIKMIKKGEWNYVILQEQSQRPSATDQEVGKTVLPYAHFLDSLIHKYCPKGKTIFYMTWGRKNGDTSRCKTMLPVCTYLGMDSLTALRYNQMAKMNHADVSPVGAVWRYLREKYPSMELYMPDESHPSETGSYAAACCFYTVILKKPPTAIKYNYTLSKSDALIIRRAVKKIVFDNLERWQNN